MKKSILLAVLSVVLTNIVFGKIWRVNNLAGVSADFTTAQAAHDHILVLPGDTLHLEPSTVSYGSLNMTKRLTIISIGDFFGANPTVQYSPLTARLTSVSISNSNANGSVLHCNLTSTLSLNGVSNIRIERCHLESTVSLTNSSSIALLNNFLYFLNLSSNTSSIVVSNNIIEYNLDMVSTASAVISNNVIKASVTNTSSAEIHNSTFQNNIINKTNLTLTFFASIVQNNLASGAMLPAGNGNLNNVVMTNVFVNPNGQDDVSFRLQTAVANPAAGAGIAGVDCGAFGGSTPFKLGLQPAMPAIYKILAPVTPAGNTMNVTFSTRSNN